MRRPSRSRLILIAIAILALIASLWLIWDRPPDVASHTENFTPQITSDNEAFDVVSARKRDTGRKQIRLEASSSAALEESAAIPDRRWPSVGTEKRRAVQSAIAGIVANSQDGTPIQDARVTLSTAGSEEVRLEAVSGHDGRFQMTIRGSGRYTLRAQADGFRPYFTDGILITPAEESLNKNILMTPQMELRGRVVDRHSRGIAGAPVWLRDVTRRPFDKKSKVQSDKSGRFLMAETPVSGTYFAETAHPEYELDSGVPVTLPEDDEVVITMRRVPDPLLASVSGHVWDSDGQPIHGARVKLIEVEPGSRLLNYLGDSSTDPTGRFFFSRVRWGTYSIGAEAGDYVHGRKALKVESSQEYEIDLVLKSGTIVQGVVVDTEGLPVATAGVHVTIVKGTGGSVIGVFNPSDGTFNIPKVPHGRHRIQVTHRDYVIYEFALVTPTDEFLTVTLEPGLSLTGYVMDKNNEQIREFSLRLSPASRQHDVAAYPFESKTADVSSSDGYFRINGLAPQTYILSLHPQNAESLETRLELLESTSVTILLDPSDSDSPLQIRKSR